MDEDNIFLVWMAAKCNKSHSHLGNLPHILNGGPFIGKLRKCFLYFGNEAVNVEIALGPAPWEVKLWNAFTQCCGDRLLRPHLSLKKKDNLSKCLMLEKANVSIEEL